MFDVYILHIYHSRPSWLMILGNCSYASHCTQDDGAHNGSVSTRCTACSKSSKAVDKSSLTITWSNQCAYKYSRLFDSVIIDFSSSSCNNKSRNTFQFSNTKIIKLRCFNGNSQTIQNYGSYNQWRFLELQILHSTIVPKTTKLSCKGEDQ
jgi:hypothetical protein